MHADRFAALARAHAFRLRRETDPRQAMLAALLINGRPHEDPSYTENDDAIRRASGSEDVFVAWLLANLCPGSPAVCNRTHRVQRLVDLEPGNALGWMLAARLAHEQGRRDAARAMLRRGASAPRFDDHSRDMLVEARRFYDPIDFDERDAGAYRVGDGLEVVRHVHAAGLAGFATDEFDQNAGALCGTYDRMPDSDVLADCIAVYRLMAESDRRGQGLYKLLELTQGSAGHFEIGERYLDWKWLEAQRVFSRVAIGDESSVRAYYDDVVASGRHEALRHLLRLHGLPTSRPADWIPEHLSEREVELLEPTPQSLPRGR